MDKLDARVGNPIVSDCAYVSTRRKSSTKKPGGLSLFHRVGAFVLRQLAAIPRTGFRRYDLNVKSHHTRTEVIPFLLTHQFRRAIFGRVFHDVDIGINPETPLIVRKILQEVLVCLCRHCQVVTTNTMKNNVK